MAIATSITSRVFFRCARATSSLPHQQHVRNDVVVEHDDDHPAAAQHLAGDSGDGDRAAQLLHAAFGAEETAEGDEGVAQHLPVLANAFLEGRAEGVPAYHDRPTEPAVSLSIFDWRTGKH